MSNKKDSKLYGEGSIESLSPLEFTRSRPGVYAGDTTYSTQLVTEIVSNSVDEVRLGHGDKIHVQLNGAVVTVRDYGQGFIRYGRRFGCDDDRFHRDCTVERVENLSPDPFRSG